jgi:hypothetical protein
VPLCHATHGKTVAYCLLSLPELGRISELRAEALWGYVVRQGTKYYAMEKIRYFWVLKYEIFAAKTSNHSPNDMLYATVLALWLP